MVGGSVLGIKWEVFDVLPWCYHLALLKPLQNKKLLPVIWVTLDQFFNYIFEYYIKTCKGFLVQVSLTKFQIVPWEKKMALWFSQYLVNFRSGYCLQCHCKDMSEHKMYVIALISFTYRCSLFSCYRLSLSVFFFFKVLSKLRVTSNQSGSLYVYT